MIAKLVMIVSIVGAMFFAAIVDIAALRTDTGRYSSADLIAAAGKKTAERFGAEIFSRGFGVI
jgi:hypothetical protein